MGLICVQIGAGIQLPTNSTRILKGWDLLGKLETRAVRAAKVSFRSYKDGSILYSQRMAPTDETYCAPFLTVHRSDYLAILIDEARRLGVTIRLGTKVSNIDFEKTMINTTSGASYCVDAIICADGLRSACRTLFAGSPPPAVPTGHLAHRVTIPTSLVSQYPELLKLTLEPDISYWLGPNSHAVTYQLKSGHLFNLVLMKADDLPESVSIASAPASEIQTHLQGWDPRLGQLFALAPVYVFLEPFWSFLSPC